MVLIQKAFENMVDNNYISMIYQNFLLNYYVKVVRHMNSIK
jgi:hypothetical protein